MIGICKLCLMPTTRPRVRFIDGVCNACLHIEERKHIDWDARQAEFSRTIDRLRKHQTYDCVVPMSGGKDSASIAYKLKHEYGLNPLCVCYGQLVWTDVGRRNLHRVADAGLDILYWRVNQQVSRALTRRFYIERGHPKNHYDSAVSAAPMATAAAFGIPLIIFAEHGESFYGGNVLSEEHRRMRDMNEVLENQVGDDARNWAVDGITEKDLFPYIFQSTPGVEAHYFSWYTPWDIYRNAEYAREKLGFEGAPFIREWPTSCQADFGRSDWQWRSDGSFEGFDSIDDAIDDLDYYMMYVKFGFGRATRMASRLIQNGHMTREQGLELVKRYDGEFPRRYLPQICEYLDMTEQEIRDVADMHRNQEIWMKEGAEWKLRHPPK